MTTSTTPTLSPFVRGTTDITDVYYAPSTTRRLIPDVQTLNFMLAGQTVRVLSDADLAAIPLVSSPLPSRKDGQLLTATQATLPAFPLVYYTQNGMRLQIPDPDTLTILENRGVTLTQIATADLNAIPFLGLRFPSFKDGTLYKGITVFGYQILSGKKLAISDATTMRDLGLQGTLNLITGADLALIPDGVPYPTTSKFLQPPPTTVPLVLLPVRLETRIDRASGELWLRVYPDDIHINSFEPALTTDEQAARTTYLALSTTDVTSRQAAFAALARQFGPERAAWITSATPSSATKASDWTLAPHTNVLPERWIVIGYQGDTTGQLLAVGPSIQDSLVVGPDPIGTTLTGDPGMKWINDFPTAIAAGMGFRIKLTPAQQKGFTRLLVVGLRTTLSPADSAARLADLLQAHHYTDGLELLPNNTPTNNAGDTSSGLTTNDPDYSQLYKLEQGAALCPSRGTADGDRLARALNIAPQTFAHVSGANGAQDEQAQAMNTVMWPATLGYYLSQIVTGIMPTPETILPMVRDHFATHVRARGHYPTLRIGTQPYGLLPVLWSASWKSIEGSALGDPLYRVLTQLRTTWEKAVHQIPRIPNAVDPEAALVSLMGMTPSSTSFVTRNAIGPEYNFAYWKFVQNELPQKWWTTLGQKVIADTSDFAAAMAKTRLGSTTYVPWHRPLSEIMVAPDPLGNLPAPAFIAQMASLGWQSLRDIPLPGAPVPVLFLLLRHAALRQYIDTALGLLTAADIAADSESIEAEMVGFTGVGLRPTAWDLLQRTLPGKGQVGTLLDASKSNATAPDFAAFWKAFGQIAKYTAADLDAVTREAMDLATYRLDSWISSLAHFRLDRMRTANPNGGIVLGGYGWVENVGIWPNQPASLGYIHAPSLNQATTAAVLRSGYLSHQGGPQKPFEIDLSSARVRLALHLIDGIREGQSLGALLGYRLERTLQELAPDQPGLFDLIDKLRALAPLNNGSQLDIVDGLALIRQIPDLKTYATTGWAATLAAPLQVALTSTLATVADALDSVADLTLSESVHQLTRGNMLRAGATLDSIARGDTPPPEIDFVQTPRTGTALTYRFMTAAIGNSAPGWATTPRAQAEPRLNAWAAALMGNPALVQIRAQFVDSTGKVLAPLQIGFDKLGLAPVDLISLPETQGIAGELADRINRAVEQTRPTSVAATAQIQILTDRDTNWTPQTISLPEWLGLLQAITRLTGASRPLEPADLLVQGAPPGVVDTAELQARADAAETLLRAALSALQSPAAQDAALVQAAAFGVTGAFPVLDSTQWKPQVAAASAELTARAAALTKLATAFVRTTASAADLKAHDTARLQTIFGPSFLVLPTLSAADAANWPSLWANSQTLQKDDTLASIRWMQRAARVRSNVTLTDTALIYAEALAGHPLLQLQVAQLPAVANDTWVGLDTQTGSRANTLSLVSFTPTPYAAGATVAGLMIDEWIEVLPSAEQITGVSFQYSDPIARAPQAILLAVPPDDFSEWTLEALEGSVLEALDLAKIRGADSDVLLGTVPPGPVDQSVRSFQAISDIDAFVLDTNGVLWLDHGPFDGSPVTRVKVDINVSSFQAFSLTEVFILHIDGTLWLAVAPFGVIREQIDSNVALTPPTPPPPPPPTPPPPPPQPPAQVRVPDVIGGTRQQVSNALASVQLQGHFTGSAAQSATATSQDPQGNKSVDSSTVVTVNFQNVSSK